MLSVYIADYIDLREIYSKEIHVQLFNFHQIKKLISSVRAGRATWCLIAENIYLISSAFISEIHRIHLNFLWYLTDNNVDKVQQRKIPIRIVWNCMQIPCGCVLLSVISFVWHLKTRSKKHSVKVICSRQVLLRETVLAIFIF